MAFGLAQSLGYSSGTLYMGSDKTPGDPSGDRDQTEALDRSDEEPALEGCVLYVSVGPPSCQGTSVSLARGRAIIGSDQNSGLVLSDPSVSRHHAELSIQSDGIHVKDLGSTNGTLYLGQQIQSALLKTGTRLQIGRCAVDILPLAGSTAVPPSDQASYGDSIGSSLAMRSLYTLLKRLENSDAPVLIEGETGTGKELVARAIHQHSARASKPYLVIDCGNMLADLIRGEIFGYRKGAFTGADTDRAGAFESANGGTVFLDEIGELPLNLQPSLLRVLETNSIQRIGESTARPVDVRVVAATHKHLADEAEAGGFRNDLYYRLAVVTLDLPPLRDRADDIPMLANHHARLLSKGKVTKLPKSVINRVIGYDWPGNVRELRNAVHRLLSVGTLGIGDEGPVSGEAFPISGTGVPLLTSDPSEEAAGTDPPPGFKSAREHAIKEFEEAYLRDLLAAAAGNISLAAKQAGIDRKYLRDLLKKYGLYER